ncbi:MAG: glycosyl hydrolase [Chloroflexota bacterium]
MSEPLIEPELERETAVPSPTPTVQATPPMVIQEEEIDKKAEILRFLEDTAAADRVIAGQNVGMASGDGTDFVLDIGQFNGLSRKPGVFAVDLGWFTDFSTEEINPTLIDEIEAAWQAGSLVTISMHMAHPVNFGGEDEQGVPFVYSDVVTDGTAVNQNFLTMMRNAADYLQLLEARGVVVLIRPFHEMNGGWFWWGHSNNWPTPEEFGRLWEYVHYYFETDRGLDNLIWVYSPNMQFDDSLKPTSYYYPGDAYVDMVCMDYYFDDLSAMNSNSSWDDLIALGKPLCLGEIGPNLGGELDGRYDTLNFLDLVEYDVSYFVAWNSWPSGLVSIRDAQNGDQMLASDRIVTQDEMTIFTVGE